MNDLVFIKDTIRQLKREYGSPLIAGKATIISQNPETGMVEMDTNEIKVSRAIRLPNQISFDFLKTIAQGKIGQIAAGTFTILLDKSDLPANFPEIGVDYAEFENQNLKILAIDDFPYCVILHVTALPGKVGKRKSLKDIFSISETVANQP